MGGKLYGRYSSMNAGKSTYLLQIAHNYNENDKQVQVLTAALDDRYGAGLVTSRLGIQREAELFTADTDFDAILRKDVACILFDESQFLQPAQITQLHRWAHVNGLPIICFCIRTDSNGCPFPGAAYLMSLADDIEEIKTVCRCGRKATMQIRLSDDGIRIRDGEQVCIGGNSRYRQVCADCFYEA